jgi:peptidoglycan LD-endopeptidase CwlK
MYKTKFLSLLILILFFTCKPEAETFENENASELKKDSVGNNIPAGLKKLLKAYPDFLSHADENNLYWKDGTVMVYDDGKMKSDHETLLNSPDLEDMMKMEYTKGKDYEIPPVNFEPGRVRYEPFFKKMYGSSAGEVQKNLVTVKWFGKNVSFNKVNGAAEQLKKVEAELQNLPNEFRKYLTPTAGTFNWRNIAGTNRLSTHAFGTSIDINTKFSNYWLWEKNLTYKNQIPLEIVEIFEKHGFIWGGKWYHYDTMHFEFRPELLVEID